MAVTEYGIVYAVHIITAQFGLLVSKVCECLLRRGPLSARDISRLTNVNHNQVKDILYLLIQHNCVQAFAVEPDPTGGETRLMVQFMVLFSNIIHRVRYNKFLKIVKEELGQQCGDVLDGLLSNGRLTVGQLMERSGESATGSEAVKEALLKLIAARYVERVPAPEPVLAKPAEEESAPKKRGSKSAKIVEDPKTLEQRVLEAATPVEALRFPLLMEQKPNLSPKNDEKSSSGNVSGVKRKQVDMDSNIESPEANNEVVWRPNFEEFVCRLRHKACVEIVKEHKDEGAAIVLGAMLEATRSQEREVKIDKSVPVSVNSIYEEVIKSEAGRNMTLERVEACLDQLASMSTCPPAFVIETDTSYIVDFKSIIEAAQKDEMESIVWRRYGKEASRMFRYLSKEGRLVETDKIADAVLTEKKDTPKILLKMWKDEYLHMEKILINSRQIPFLLWKVNEPILRGRVLDEMFHASLNLSLRLTHELDQEKELLSLPLGKLEGKLKERLNKIKEKRLLLSSTRFKLDDAIMLFHDF